MNLIPLIINYINLFTGGVFRICGTPNSTCTRTKLVSNDVIGKEVYCSLNMRIIPLINLPDSKKGGTMAGNTVNNMQDPINALQNLARQGRFLRVN